MTRRSSNWQKKFFPCLQVKNSNPISHNQVLWRCKVIHKPQEVLLMWHVSWLFADFLCVYCFFIFSILMSRAHTTTMRNKVHTFFLIHWAMMGVEWNVRRHLNKNNKNLRIRNVLLLPHAMIWDLHTHILVVYSIVIWNKHGMCWCHGKFSFTSTAYPLITMNKIFCHEFHIRKRKRELVLFFLGCSML